MRLPLFPLLALGLILAPSLPAQSVAFNLQSVNAIPSSSFIVFTPTSTPGAGDLAVTFQPNSAGEDFTISGANLASLDSFTGTINGTFTISNITSSGSLQQGTVSASPSASLVISDGLGDTETAHLWWNSAYTLFSTGGINSFDMNAGVSQNLSQFTYAGSANSTLQQDFAGITTGNVVISFSFASTPNSLIGLADAPSATSDSFSGQVAEIPEPGTYAALLAGVALAAAAMRRVFQDRMG